MLLSLLGGLFGGLLRFAPELLKFLDGKNDRAHELAMMDKQLLFLQEQGKLKIDEARMTTDATIQQAQFQTMMSAYQAEQVMLSHASTWVNNINALIRPSVTFGVFTLWTICRLAVIFYSFHATGDVKETLVNAWTAEDAALLSAIAAYYFVSRTLDKRG
jgi:hypothetical protein